MFGAPPATPEPYAKIGLRLYHCQDAISVSNIAREKTKAGTPIGVPAGIPSRGRIQFAKVATCLMSIHSTKPD
jgi:hypothetical protein